MSEPLAWIPPINMVIYAKLCTMRFDCHHCMIYIMEHFFVLISCHLHIQLLQLVIILSSNFHGFSIALFSHLKWYFSLTYTLLPIHPPPIQRKTALTPSNFSKFCFLSESVYHLVGDMIVNGWDIFQVMGIYIIKIRRSWETVISLQWESPIRVRRHLYIKMLPWS